MNLHFASVFVGVVLVAGCASVGQDFDMTEVDDLQPSVSTFEQVKEKFGKPQSVSNASDGGFVAGWVRSQASPLGASTKSVMIIFDKDGKLIRVASRFENKTN